MAVKRALVDLWQLAFSYQVNPLAAVQPLSATTRQGTSGGRARGTILWACANPSPSLWHY
ncbi:hypothetical protein JHK82_018421 [Glycine max]|nr:hypothetical protein JHK85_018852 [Glycine max]KAG5142726.1 hypothetical protein JHK82_018421 [Glycine max]